MTSLLDEKLIIIQIDDNNLFGSALEGGVEMEMAAASGGTCSTTSTCCTSCTSCAALM